MLTSEDNELLCRVGSGTPMGDLIRQYWIPVLLTSELPEPDCPPVRVRLLGENLIAFRVTSGKVGLIQNHCPHRGASLFYRPQRGGRTPLRLSRLEVRLHGRLRRHAERAGGEHLQGEGPGARLSVCRAQRRRLGLHGPAADTAAAARPRAQHAGSRRVRRAEGVARVQLVPGPGGRHRHRPPELPAPRRRQAGRHEARQLRLLQRDRPRTALRGRRHVLRHVVRRVSPRGTRHVLLAHRALPVPVLHDDSHRHPRHAGPRARVGAGRRRARHVLEHRECRAPARAGEARAARTG